MLGGKTRILVTHAIDFLHLADRVVVMDGGEIVV
jgi:ABC-type proline/glycine betaine transport system ATPase subunit